MAPFANRLAGSMFATSITRIRCGFSSPGHGGSFAHWPAKTRLGKRCERILRLILAMFCLLLYHPARLCRALYLAFTFSWRPPPRHDAFQHPSVPRVAVGSLGEHRRRPIEGHLRRGREGLICAAHVGLREEAAYTR